MSLVLSAPVRSAAFNRGAILVGFWVLLAAAADLITPYDPTIRSIKEVMLPPSWAHWFGTDDLGRDIFSRMLYATRLDLAIAILGIFPPLVIGSFLGLLASYGGRAGELTLAFLARSVGSFPTYFLALPILALSGSGLRGFLVAVALTGWVPFALRMAGEIRTLKESEFVAAAEGLGFTSGRVFALHVLPNAILPALLLAVSETAGMLLLGSTLGFFGLIAPGSDAEWGAIIAEGAGNPDAGWWVMLFPGLAVLMLAAGFRLLGDGLAERFGSAG